AAIKTIADRSTHISALFLAWLLVDVTNSAGELSPPYFAFQFGFAVEPSPCDDTSIGGMLKRVIDERTAIRREVDYAPSWRIGRVCKFEVSTKHMTQTASCWWYVLFHRQYFTHFLLHNKWYLNAHR